MSTEFKSFFKAVGGNEGGKCNYATRLDTYGCGCQHNCAYCYARALLDFRGLWDYQNPAVAPIADIRKTIQRELKRGDIVRLGGMTDCFHDYIYHKAEVRFIRGRLRFGDSKQSAPFPSMIVIF